MSNPNFNFSIRTQAGDILPFHAVSYITVSRNDEKVVTVADTLDGKTVKLCDGDLREEISMLLRMNVSTLDLTGNTYYEDEEECGNVTNLLENA